MTPRKPSFLQVAEAHMPNLVGKLADADWLEFWLDRIEWREAQRRDAPGVQAENGNRFVAAP